MTRLIGLLDGMRRFMIGGGFPSFALSLMLGWELFLISMVLMPASSSGLGAFAEDFRIWCFGYDPATGRTQWAYVMAMLTPQLLTGAFITLFWWEPLVEIARQPRRLAKYTGAAAFLVIAATGSLSLSSTQPQTGELPFPAEALRTAYAAPELRLTNQLGEPVDLSLLKGQVVLLTAVYASCPHTCPAILAQTRSAIDELAEQDRAGLRVVAVTMDPQNDSPEVLSRLAKNHGMPAPLYNLVTGEPSEVERVLDRMQVARERDPETGVINHANLFLLLDREGRLAYRLGLGDRQQRWLVSALRVLLKEPGAEPDAGPQVALQASHR